MLFNHVNSREIPWSKNLGVMAEVCQRIVYIAHRISLRTFTAVAKIVATKVVKVHSIVDPLKVALSKSIAKEIPFLSPWPSRRRIAQFLKTLHYVFHTIVVGMFRLMMFAPYGDWKIPGHRIIQIGQLRCPSHHRHWPTFGIPVGLHFVPICSYTSQPWSRRPWSSGMSIKPITFFFNVIPEWFDFSFRKLPE